MQCLVSACLLGQACRYDGASKPHAGVQAAVQTWQREGVQVTAVCPEELGDLGTPRPGAHLVGGDGHAVLAGQASVQRVADAGDVTAEFVAGAQRAAAVAPDAQFAVLKSFSPSCGCGWTEIDGLRQAGDGVFAAFLRQRGVKLCTEAELGDWPAQPPARATR